jgi:hypothetical protein
MIRQNRSNKFYFFNINNITGKNKSNTTRSLERTFFINV